MLAKRAIERGNALFTAAVERGDLPRGTEGDRALFVLGALHDAGIKLSIDRKRVLGAD